MVWSLIQSLSFTGFGRGEFESLSPSMMTGFFIIFPVFPCAVLTTLFHRVQKKKSSQPLEVDLQQPRRDVGNSAAGGETYNREEGVLGIDDEEEEGT